MIVGEHALAQERRGHREVEALGEPDQRVGGAVAGHTRAGQHDRVSRLRQDVRGAVHLVLVGRGIDRHVHLAAASPSVSRSATSSGRIRNVAPGRSVVACLNALRTISGAAAAHRHHVAPLRDRPEQRHEVDELVRLLVDPVEPRLRRDRDQRMRVQLGVRDARASG